MLALAPARKGITHVVWLIALVACKQEDKAAPTPPPPPPSATVAADAAAEDKSENKITISVGKPASPSKALGKRCVFGGDPLTSDCIGGGSGLAFDQAGVLYLVAGKEVRRYQRVDGDECRYDPAGEPIALPPENQRPQKLGGGPVYMRSGGPAWHVVAAGDAVYAFDFLGGLYRIDRGKPEPACVDEFGYNSVVARGKKLLVNRKGIEQLALGKKCKASSAKVDDKARGELYAIRDQLYVTFGGEITRYDGTTPVKLGEGTRICSVTALTACGDGFCAADNNCMQVVQFGKDGKVVRTLESEQLFHPRPWGLQEAATRADGTVLVHARYRDTTNNKEICEAAIYELPPALFAL